MPKKIAISTLNASTIDILNTIRANASAQYQSLVPVVTTEHDLPAVGDVLFGYPGLANEFVSALMNRIAYVRIKSSTFNNPFAALKKGFLQNGEVVEDVFVQMAKAREFSAEKAEARELKRSLPDVKAAFHAINWRVYYPVTIQDEDLRQAFLSMDGVQEMIAKIVDSVYRGAAYDEFLLFKYLIIKAVSHGKMAPVAFDATKMDEAATAFRGYSNALTFVSDKYNEAGVHTNTDKADQYIFMDSHFNAAFDVEELARAFNMDRAEFFGKLQLIDDFTSFDNERFEAIRAESDGLEEVTAAELALMADVKAVLVDGEWFQIYDNLDKMTEKYVASGLYWNYFYHTWKIVSSSPFSNAIVFVDDGATTSLPATLTLTVTGKDTDANATILTAKAEANGATLQPNVAQFVQTQAAVTNGIAVHPYGAVVIPVTSPAVTYVPVVKIGETLYQQSGSNPTALGASTNVGVTITLTKNA